MGYYSGDLTLEQARELAANRAREAANRAKVPRGFCAACQRPARLVPTRGEVQAHHVHADDGTPLCPPPAGAGE